MNLPTDELRLRTSTQQAPLLLSSLGIGSHCLFTRGLPGEDSSAVAFSRFHSCDLQVHNPADRQQGYGDVGGPTPNPSFARTLIEAHANAGVEVIAVTDHNRVDWYPVLSEAGEACGVFVFPGLEVSVNGCHLLAIWDRTEESFGLAERFAESLWPPGQSRFTHNGDPRPVASGQVLEVAARATEHRALVFAPHATAKRIGLFARGVCNNHVEVAQSGSVLGYDVYGDRNADVLRNPNSVFRGALPPWFISGDVRLLDHVGQRTTYLKLAPEPTLEGIRQAFLMPDTRLRFPKALCSAWQHVLGLQFIESPTPTWPRIESVDIQGGFHSGLKAGLGPGLNAIIGGKGTGKSTLIEIIRYVADAGEPLLDDGNRNRRVNFRANAEANIGIVDDQDESYEIHRSGDGAPARLLRNGRDTEVGVRRRFTLTVFGQRELQELVSREGMLRKFVASQAGPEWEDTTRQESALIDDLRASDTELTQLESTLHRMQEHVEELKDIQERLMRAHDRGAHSLVDASNGLAETDRDVSRLLAWPNQVSEATDGLERKLPAPNIPSHPLTPENLQGDMNKLEVVVSKAVVDLRSALQIAEHDIRRSSEDWRKSHQDERHRIQSALAEAGIANPDELDSLQRRQAELASFVENREVSVRRKDELSGLRTSLLSSLADVRRRKSRLTERAARELTGNVGQRVRVKTNPLADRSKLLELFESNLKGQHVRKSQLERLVQSHPSAIASAILEGPGALESLGCSPAAAAKVAQLPSSVARACEECEIPDQVIVEIDLGRQGDEHWMQVQEVSPGQRATALLALALASGNHPLIIDQPEDDLDNRYIYDEVVKVLRTVCKHRQVIVATHNANVAVLGDAELVLALDADSGQSELLAQGGLESPNVAETTRRILEGGDEAFRARHRRYSASEPGSA